MRQQQGELTDMRADFVIIGGGISGAAAAFFLSEAGRVVLIEQ